MHEQGKRVQLTALVNRIRAKFYEHREDLLKLRVWMISSTSRGGGVSEMLPRIICLMKEFGMTVEWLIMDSPDNNKKSKFFSLTKHLHNNIHGDGVPLDYWGGCGMERQHIRRQGTSANEIQALLLPEDVEKLNNLHISYHVPPLAESIITEEIDEETVPTTPSPSLSNTKNITMTATAGETPVLTESEHIRQLRKLYEDFNTENAITFFTKFLTDVDTQRDLILIHDPQPAGIIKYIRDHYPQLLCVWRCHIGLDIENDATRSAWSFLDPYITMYDACVFSSPEYIRSSVKHKSATVHPGIAPLAPKNKELSAYDITQILMRAGLMDFQQASILEQRGCELIDPPFEHRAKIYKIPGMPSNICQDLRYKSKCVVSTSTTGNTTSEIKESQSNKSNFIKPISNPIIDQIKQEETESGSPIISPRSDISITSTESTLSTVTEPIGNNNNNSLLSLPVPIQHNHLCTCISCLLPLDGIPFLHRPVLTQISRWDRLKGWKPLMLAWAELKSRTTWYIEQLDLMTPASNQIHDIDRHRKMIQNSLLVLAGPDPTYIKDDPEGLEVLNELKSIYNSLPLAAQCDMKIIELPMNNVVENALIVNAIQRASLIIIQNSIREGFGLTIAEAMYKRTAVIGTEQAVGLRTQIQHGIDGILVQGNADDPINVAQAINTLLGNDVLREEISVNAQKRATDNSLIFSQMEEWLYLVISLLQKRKQLQHGKLIDGTDEAQISNYHNNDINNPNISLSNMAQLLRHRHHSSSSTPPY